MPIWIMTPYRKRWLPAVSYTHLDVYKRQVQTPSGGSTVTPNGEIYDGQALTPGEVGISYVTVSYTHLDVYKRQLWGTCPMRR